MKTRFRLADAFALRGPISVLSCSCNFGILWLATAVLLALVLASKYDQHLPLNRQSGIYAREGVVIEVSTLADWVGACAASLEPITARIRREFSNRL